MLSGDESIPQDTIDNMRNMALIKRWGTRYEASPRMEKGPGVRRVRGELSNKRKFERIARETIFVPKREAKGLTRGINSEKGHLGAISG